MCPPRCFLTALHQKVSGLIVSGAGQVAALAAGDAHSAALTTNGFLFTWGSNDRGQLGLPALAEVAAQARCSISCSLTEVY